MTKIQEMVGWLEREWGELNIYTKAQEKSPDHIWHKGAKSQALACLGHEQQRVLEALTEARRLADEEAKEKPTDLWGQHKQMIKLAQDHGLNLAANWAVNMSGKTFSEEKPTAPVSLVEGLCGSCNGSGLVQIAPNVRGMHTCPTCKGKGKMMGIRPASQTTDECNNLASEKGEKHKIVTKNVISSRKTGRYSSNCKWCNTERYCTLPEEEDCRMGFISRCSGTIPPRHPSPEVKGEAREHLEWKGSIDATAKALDKKREDNKGGI